MDEYKYNVSVKWTIDNIIHDEIIAENMTLDDAAILVKAYFETYYAEPGMVMSIGRVHGGDNHA